MTSATAAAPARTAPAPIITETDKDAIHARLLTRCEYDPATNCWVYTGAWDKNGLGAMKVGGRLVPVHRVSAWIYRGGFDLWDRSVKVRHRCKNCCPACFNPDHLAIKRKLPTAAEAERLRFPLFYFFDQIGALKESEAAA